MKRILALIMTLVVVFTLVGCGAQQEIVKGAEKVEFPKKPMEIIVPYSAGGGTDAVSRALADSAKNYFSQPVVVVNKTGGGGAIGHAEGAKAKPDGHTLTMITVELTTLPHLGVAPFTYEDFKPIMMINSVPAAVTVKADAPWNTIEEFLAYAKENPGKVRIGNSGVGAIWHLAAAALETKAGVEFNHVPYDGAAPAVAAILGGHIEAITVSPAEVGPQVKAGQLKMLGVMANERVEDFPEVPTLKEEGIDVAIGTWRGLGVPKDTPDEIVQIIQDGFFKATEEQSFKEFMNKGNLPITILNSQQYLERIKQDNDIFKDLIEKLGLKQ